MPLEKITLNEFESSAGGPTYRVHALDAAGNANSEPRIQSRDGDAAVQRRDENATSKWKWRPDGCGWKSDRELLLNQRIKTDIEEYWDKYQNEVLPKVYHFVMSQAHGDLRQEFRRHSTR